MNQPAQEAADVETLTTPVDGQEADQGTVSEPVSQPEDDIEARARDQGWVPKEEFRGPPEKWRSAEEFVQRGETILPILRDQLHQTQAKLKESEATFQQRLERMERMNQIALKKQRESIEAQYFNAKAAAVEAGDLQRWHQLERDQSEALRQHDTQVYETLHQPAPQPQANGLTQHQQTVIQDWVSKNPWFEKDKGLEFAARGEIARLEQQMPFAPLEQILDLAASEVRKRYADRFGQQTQPQPRASVQSGTRVATSRSRVKGVSDLPPEARTAGERFVREGIFKSMDEYAHSYHAQD